MCFEEEKEEQEQGGGGEVEKNTGYTDMHTSLWHAFIQFKHILSVLLIFQTTVMYSSMSNKKKSTTAAAVAVQATKKKDRMVKKSVVYAFVKCIHFDSYWTSNGSNSVQISPFIHLFFSSFSHNFFLTISRRQSGWETVNVTTQQVLHEQQQKKPLDAK